MNRLSPLLFQTLETPTWPMAKPIQQLKALLGLKKACVLKVKLGLVEPLKAVQNLLKGFGGVNKDSPFAIAQDEFMHRLASMNLALACAETTKERFQIVVGAIAFRPPITGEEAWPALFEGKTNMGNGLAILGVVLGMLFQVRQEVLDLTLDGAAGRWRLFGVLGRVEAPVQLHQPVPLSFELPILSGKRPTPLHHRE